MTQGDPPSMDPGPIMRLATAYWESCCLLAANEVGVFDVLADGPMDAEAIASRLNFDPRMTRLFLNACVGLELLRKEGDRFANTPRSQLFLVSHSSAYLGNAIRYGGDMWGAWGALRTALEKGGPPRASSDYTGNDPQQTRHFVHGMRDRAASIAGALVSLVDLGERRSLLDVGGGPGTYAAMFAARYPQLQATVVDLPEVAAIARELLDETEGGDRVEVVAGDYHSFALPADQDVILMSGIFHRETEETCRDLIVRARAALAPGGLLIVADVFADDGGASPAFAALFGVNMMLSAIDGGVHASNDVARWMQEAGLARVEVEPFPDPMPHRVVLGGA